jgi:hypothetical protein
LTRLLGSIVAEARNDMSDLIAQIQKAQRDAGERAVIAHLERGGMLKINAPRTYVNDAGEEKRDRRRKDRDNDDPRIEHLFSGFDSRIESAKMNGDEYAAGYMKAMRQEFGQLIASLVR